MIGQLQQGQSRDGFEGQVMEVHGRAVQSGVWSQAVMADHSYPARSRRLRKPKLFQIQAPEPVTSCAEGWHLAGYSLIVDEFPYVM
jgi:hypothetical protein